MPNFLRLSIASLTVTKEPNTMISSSLFATFKTAFIALSTLSNDFIKGSLILHANKAYFKRSQFSPRSVCKLAT